MKKELESPIDWLKEKKGFLTLARLEKSANIPAGLLSKALKGTQTLSEKHFEKLILVLKEYGYK